MIPFVQSTWPFSLVVAMFIIIWIWSLIKDRNDRDARERARFIRQMALSESERRMELERPNSLKKSNKERPPITNFHA